MCCLIAAPLTSNFGFLRLLFALISFCAVGCSPSPTEMWGAGSQFRSGVKNYPCLCIVFTLPLVLQAFSAMIHIFP